MKKPVPKISLKKASAHRSPRDIQRTRNNILKAATKEFARAGLKGSRVDVIAKRAGVNKAMIYYIFKSKEELYLKVLEELFENKTRDVNPSDTNVDLLTVLSAYFDAFAKNEDIVRMMFHDIASGASALRELKRRRPDLFQSFALASGILAARIKEGKFKDIDPDKSILLTVMVIVSLVATRPHLDLTRDKGTKEHAALSDLADWKLYLAHLVRKVLSE